MRIGTVFEQTSATEFVAMLDSEIYNERLLFSYVELSAHGGNPDPESERIIARIVSLHKENPLLSRDQAGMASYMSQLNIPMSERFTYGWASCTVVGAMSPRGLDMNRRVISPNGEVHTPSKETLRQLFFNPDPAHIPIGTVETFGDSNLEEVPVTLNADQLVTKHFCIFGMTGAGKTNTSAKVLEELMARGQKLVIFDPHDDYINLDNYGNLFRYKDRSGREITLDGPDYSNSLEYALRQLDLPDNTRRHLFSRLLRTSSFIQNNTPLRDFLSAEGRSPKATGINQQIIDAIADDQYLNQLVSNAQARRLRVFPELKYYGSGFEDFTISLLQAFRGEFFTVAQWRWLSQHISRINGRGIDFLNNLENQIGSNGPRNESTRAVMEQTVRSLRRTYLDASSSGAAPLDIESFANEVASHNSNVQQSAHIISLSDLSSNLRKAMVYGVVTYFFRSFKFGNYRSRQLNNQRPNAYPVTFILEEARALIPKSSGAEDTDTSGKLAKSSMREIAYEGRKFSLGFGLISQKPSTVDQEVTSQANTFILHQLKSPDDQQYVRAVTESMSQEELDMIKSLGTGRAIVAGVAVKSPVLVNIFYRYSQEGILEPKPISDRLQESVDQIRQQLIQRQNNG